jgi:regulator of sigma E protease
MEMVFGPIFWFLVATGVLVTFHEFGHFWVARRCGVKVLRFSIGLGKPMWTRMGRDGTEYVLAAIPLGGYVKMLDEREGDVTAADLPRAFNRKSLAQRTAIVLAGPIFNLVFALAAFWLMLVVGVRDYAPIVGEATGLAQRSGLQAGDLIVGVSGSPVSNWTHVLIDLTTRAYRGESVELELRKVNGSTVTQTINLGDLGERVDEERFLGQLGLKPWHWVPPALVGSVGKGEPAEKAGLQPGDRIAEIGGTKVDTFVAMSKAIQADAAKNAGLVHVVIVRNGVTESLSIQSRADVRNGKTFPVIGIGPELRESVRSYGPLEAIPQSFVETWRLINGSAKVIYHMLVGDAQLKNVSGPISIAQFANYSAQGGFAKFLEFLGLISLSLCIMNLLPIPILDGGHLLYYFIEWVKGSPLSERAQAYGQYLGLGALLALMCLAFFNDLTRVFST